MRFAQPMLSSAGRRPGEEAVRRTAPSQARPLSPRERQKQCLSGLPQAYKRCDAVFYSAWPQPAAVAFDDSSRTGRLAAHEGANSLNLKQGHDGISPKRSGSQLAPCSARRPSS